jgi:hypothetical protein
MKRTVFLVMALFALMAVGVYAQTEADFEVDSDGKTVEITGYKGSATTVVIPARIKNLPVTVIGDGSFSNKPFTSVTIPNGVTEIGENAFSGSDSLTTITIPNSVTRIRNTAFDRCRALTSVTIGSGVTNIASSAFRGCTSLTSVTFAGSIPASGFNANAFNGLGDIRDKYLAANGGAGTYTRPNGTATTWTKSASATAAPAAAGTAGLSFTLSADGKGYRVNRGTVNRGDVVIPASYNNLPVTTVSGQMFNGNDMITSVIIPGSVTLVADLAFANCTNLISVTFGSANTKFNGADFTAGQDLLQNYQKGGAGTYTRSGPSWKKQ